MMFFLRKQFNSDSPNLYLCLQASNRDLLYSYRTERGELQRSLPREKEDVSSDLERESRRLRHERSADL